MRADDELLVLAGDHREPHVGRLLGIGDRSPTTAERDRVRAVKRMIAAAFEQVRATDVAPRTLGVLLDEEYAGDVAREVAFRGATLVMPVEASGLDHFRRADPHVLDRVLACGPGLVKALVRFNPDGDARRNADSIAALRAVDDELRRAGVGLMLEVVVPPTAEQLAASGDVEGFVREHRPTLLARTIRDLRAAGLEPAVWKVEGIDDPDAAAAVSAAARDDAPRPPHLVVLGAGVAPERLARWLRVAATTPGYTGFAVGRSLWWPAARGLLTGVLTARTAAESVAAEFRAAIATYRGGGATQRDDAEPASGAVEIGDQ